MRYSGITTEPVVIQRNFSLYWTICTPGKVGKLQTAACQPVLRGAQSHHRTFWHTNADIIDTSVLCISVSCSVDLCAAAHTVTQSWDVTPQASELIHHTLHPHHWENACCSAKLITLHKWALLVFDLDAGMSTNVTLLANIYVSAITYILHEH